MDGRLHERLPLNLPARIINLTQAGGPADAELLDISGAGACVRVANLFVPGDLVRVDFSEGSFFGQVIHANPDGPELRCGVEVFDVLLGSSDLSRLVQQILSSRGPLPDDRASVTPASAAAAE